MPGEGVRCGAVKVTRPHKWRPWNTGCTGAATQGLGSQPWPDLGACGSTRETRPDSRQLGAGEDTGGTARSGVGRRPGKSGSGQNRWAPHQPLSGASASPRLCCAGGGTAPSGRRSGWRSCGGASAPTSLRSRLRGLTMTQCADEEIQTVASLQGKRCTGPGPALPAPVRSGFQPAPSQPAAPARLTAFHPQGSDGESSLPAHGQCR